MIKCLVRDCHFVKTEVILRLDREEYRNGKNPSLLSLTVGGFACDDMALGLVQYLDGHADGHVVNKLYTDYKVKLY